MNRPNNFSIKIAQSIIDQAIMEDKPHYLMKWKDLPHQYDTWEPLENLQNIVDMVQKWVRNKRGLNNKNKNQFDDFQSIKSSYNQKNARDYKNASSYCDTVNYIHPQKMRKRKRKIIQKPMKNTQPKKKNPNVVVLLDEQDEVQNIDKTQIHKINKESPEQQIEGNSNWPIEEESSFYQTGQSKFKWAKHEQSDIIEEKLSDDKTAQQNENIQSQINEDIKLQDKLQDKTSRNNKKQDQKNDQDKEDSTLGGEKYPYSTRSHKLQNIEPILKGVFPLRFNPQQSLDTQISLNLNDNKVNNTQQRSSKVSSTLKNKYKTQNIPNVLPKQTQVQSGMKVVGRIRPQQIQHILAHFYFKQSLILKIQLQDGRVTNMRQQDLKKMCPQLLMEYYEEVGIDI